MRILILGAGGVGGFYGSHLLAAGRDVTFLVRPKRAAQLAETGLTMLSPLGNLKLPPPPTVLSGKIDTVWDLILLSCKSYDLASSIDAIAPAVCPETCILPLLNGMVHMDTLDQRFGRKCILGGVTNVSAARDSAGHILHLNQLDSVDFGDRDDPSGARINRVAETLSNAGFVTNLSVKVLQDMWNKWVGISSVAGFTCLMRAAVGDFVAAGAAPLYLQFLDECVSVAAAEGYPITPEYRSYLVSKFTEPGSPFTTSMLRDIEVGSKIEAQQIIGALFERARQHNLKAPLLEVVNANLRSYEERRKRESNQL